MNGVCLISFQCWGSPFRVLDFYEGLRSNSFPCMGPRSQIPSLGWWPNISPRLARPVPMPALQGTRGQLVISLFLISDAREFSFLPVFLNVWYILSIISTYWRQEVCLCYVSLIIFCHEKSLPFPFVSFSR